MKPQRLPFWKRQLPNLITGLRIACIPPVMFALMYDTYEAGWCAAIFFIVASVSDFFDGYFARIYNVESLLGKFLDPVADKLLVTAALVMLIPLGRVSAILVVMLLSRDLLINGLRAVAATEKFVIGAGWTGKWKTGAQMTAIPCLMVKEPLWGVIDILTIGHVLLWISLGLSLLSGFQYIRDFFSRYSEMP
jgi:CDP-diacylglycerol--glycerol-3-phosphate 3-phosphatidyltransferase